MRTNHRTCEVCCANDIDNNVEEAGKSMEEMKKLLSVWMQDQHWYQIPFSLMLIQEKVNSFYEDLKKHREKS